jgi:hypothetical protein
VIATTQKKIMNKKRVADYDFAITTLKKDGLQKNRLYWEKRYLLTSFALDRS